MAHLTEKDYADFKKLCDKQGIHYDTEAEYRHSAQSLLNLAEISLDMAMEHHGWEKRLEAEQKGFAVASEGRTCHLCRSNISGEMWFDKWGLKCMDCQRALDKKLIPGYVFTDDKNEKYITGLELSWRKDLRMGTIRKLVRQGKLKAREVPGNGTLVFLKKENPDLGAVVDAEVAEKKLTR